MSEDGTPVTFGYHDIRCPAGAACPDRVGHAVQMATEPGVLRNFLERMSQDPDTGPVPANAAPIQGTPS